MITHLVVDGFEAVGAAPAVCTGCGDCMLQRRKHLVCSSRVYDLTV